MFKQFVKELSGIIFFIAILMLFVIIFVFLDMALAYIVSLISPLSFNLSVLICAIGSVVVIISYFFMIVSDFFFPILKDTQKASISQNPTSKKKKKIYKYHYE